MSRPVLVVAGLWLAILVVKVILAASLELHYDEGYYWQASARPALAYPDKPGLTPLLVHAGRALLGDSLTGARAPFLLLGALLPLAVYRLARPVVGPSDALAAAGLSMLLPLAALLGLHAFHDTPMVLAMLVGTAAFAAALRRDHWFTWLVLGAAGAAGFLAHYRFVTFPAAVLIFMLASPAGRRLWRRPGPWLAAAVAALGLLPTLAFVLEHGAGPLRYHFVERNPWQFQPKGLRFALEQAAVTTPLLYAALIAALALLLRRARRGDAVAGWLACAALVMAGPYYLLAPFADLKHATAHWPLPGYLPLLVVLPAVLRRLAGGGRWRRVLAVLVPTTAGLGTAAMLGYFAAAAWPEAPVGRLVQRLAADQATVAWHRLQPAIAAHLRPETVLVAGHYRAAGALDRLFGAAHPVYVVDHPLNWANGYGLSYRLWRLDDAGLAADRPGARALLVLPVEDLLYHDPAEVAGLQRICARFADLQAHGEADLPGGRQAVRLLTGTVQPHAADAAADCPALPRHYLARPKRGEAVDGRFEVLGWAMDEAGVQGADILIDGRNWVAARYGDPWPPHQLRPGQTDPNQPNVGFHAWLDAGDLPPGQHRIAIRARYADGRTAVVGERLIFVRHPWWRRPQ